MCWRPKKQQCVLQVAATRKASLRAVATSAVREARNGQTFVRQVKVHSSRSSSVIGVCIPCCHGLCCSSKSSGSAPTKAAASMAFIRSAEHCQPAQDRLGMDVEVISGFEEARLIYLGVLQVLFCRTSPVHPT